MKPHRKMITKMPDVSQIAQFGKPTENFINTVTQFHYNIKQQNINIEPTSIATSSDLSNFVKIFFKFSYYLLVSPFRVVTDESGRFVIKKWRPQEICCAFMQALCIIRLATEVRTNLEKGYGCKQDSKNPVQYFLIILDAASFIYKVMTMKRMWFNQKDYLYAMNFCRGRSQFSPNLTILKVLHSSIFIHSFFSLATGLAFSSLAVGKKFVDESSSWSPALWVSQLVKLARYTFFLQSKFDKKDIKLVTPIFSIDGFRAFIMGLCMLQRYLHGIFCDLFILSFTMTLWSASKSFSAQIFQYTEKMEEEEMLQWDAACRNQMKTVSRAKRNILHSWDDVYSHFRLIQQLSSAINTALGSQVTCYMAEAVMYYSVHLNLVLSSHDVFVRIDLAFFYFSTFGILFISADICAQLESIKLWISHGENRKGIPADEFGIILHEMVTKDIGIRGNNIFTITYSLLAMFFSTVVTYFIICVQQGNDTSENPSISSSNTTTLCD